MQRLFVFISICTSTAALAQPAAVPNNLHSLRAALTRTRNRFTSVTTDLVAVARHTEDYDRTFTEVPLPRMRERHGRFIADRTTYRLDYGAIPPGPGELGVPSETLFWDGKRLLALEQSPLSNGMSGSLWWRPGAGTPLDYAYTHKGVWYSDVLARPGYRMAGVTADEDGRCLIIAEGPAESGRTLRVAFAPDRGYMAVRADLSAVPDREESGSATWIVDEARDVNGLWLPVRARMEKYLEIDGRSVLMSELTLTLTSPQTGLDCTKLLQPPSIPAGTMVTDRDARAIYEATPTGSLRYLGPQGSPAGPMTAMQHPGPWLGVALLGAAAVSSVALRRKTAR